MELVFLLLSTMVYTKPMGVCSFLRHRQLTIEVGVSRTRCDVLSGSYEVISVKALNAGKMPQIIEDIRNNRVVRKPKLNKAKPSGT